MIDFVNIVQSKEEQAKFLGLSVLCWMTLYILVVLICKVKGIKKKDQDDLNNRIVSIVHGILSFVYAAYHIYNERPAYGSYNTPAQVVLLLISTSYFINDLLACIYFGLADGGLLIHHTLAISGYMVGVYYNYGATDGIQGILYAEVSNLPMHLRAITKLVGLRYTKFYEAMEIFYMVLYIISRGILCPVYLVYPCIYSEMTPLLIKFICFGIFFQSLFFIKTMMAIFARKKRNQVEKNKLDVHYFWFSENPKCSQLSYYQNKSSKDKIF